MKRIFTPLDIEQIKTLKVLDKVSLTGTIYTARDQAHKRLIDELKKRGRLPFSLDNQIIYYCGPTATPGGRVIGSCGPTTASRMDEFTTLLLKNGLKGMIGKGRRSHEVRDAVKKYKAVYFLAYAGCGALLSRFVKKRDIFAYKDLGPEAIYKLEVKDFPLIVAIDSGGGSVYR